MSSKRLTLLTVNFLKSISNASSSRSQESIIKTLSSQKCISTAAEKSDFQNSGVDLLDNYSESGVSPIKPDLRGNFNGFNYGDQRNSELCHRPGGISGHSSNGFGQNSNRAYGQNPSGFQHSFNDFSIGNTNPQSSCRQFPEGPRDIAQNKHEYRSNIQGNFRQNPDQFQAGVGYPSSGSTGMFQHGSSSGQLQQSLIGGLHAPNMVSMPGGSHMVSNVKQEAESGETSGTLEELDGFWKDGKVKEAVEVLELLEKKSIPVDLSRCLLLMEACGEAKALEEAKRVHQYVLRSLSPLKVSTYNRILEMYAKASSMYDALAVFNIMPERNLTSWDIMIIWLAKNGFAEDAIDLFTEFKSMGLRPDGQMYNGVFFACSMLGDSNEGMLHFESMSKDYGITPSMDNYVSVVDMLGSIGHVDEALAFVEKMPLEPSVNVWETLMNISRVHGYTELGDRCAEIVEQLDSSHINEQAKAGLVPIKASDLAKEKERKKLASQNLLEVKSRVHEYRAGDRSHPENDKIYALLRGMKEQMKEAGYIPDLRYVLHDIDPEGKEEALLAHSERLAVAYGLLSSSVRSPIRVIKNLRVCVDCHSALKIISKIVGRELIMRDAKRFHHFKDGVCSCRDYW